MAKKKEAERGLCIDCRHAVVKDDGTDGNPIVIRCEISGTPQVAMVHRCDTGQYGRRVD